MNEKALGSIPHQLVAAEGHPDETLLLPSLKFENYEAFQNLLPARMRIEQNSLNTFIIDLLRRDLTEEQVSKFCGKYRILFVEERYIPGHQSEMTRGICTDDEIDVCVGAPGERYHWKAAISILAHETGHGVCHILNKPHDYDRPYEDRPQEKYARYYVNEFRTFFGRFAKKQKRKQ